MSKQSVGTWFKNWFDSDLPLGKKLKVTSRNLSTRLKGKQCCGMHGDPGC